jgi:hypothetical protein
MAARRLGIQDVPCIRLSHLTDTQKRAYIIADNKLALNAGWDEEMLKLEFEELEELGFDLDLTGFTLDEIADLAQDEDQEEQEDSSKETGAGSLAGRFMLPPFSVLNAREGWWQDRKKAWLALGIKSELGRGENGHAAAPGGSIMVSGYDKDGNRLVGLKRIRGNGDGSPING